MASIRYYNYDAWIFLILTLPSIVSLRVEPLPKIHINDLTTSDFKSKFLNTQAVILTGATTCPTNLNLANIKAGKVCHGTIPGNYIHTKNKDPNEDLWAGLKAGNPEESIDFNDWVRHMGQGDKKEAQFLFDAPMAELCPTLFEHVTIPAHLTGIFESQLEYRDLRDRHNNINSDGTNMDQLCSTLPFYNIYLAEASFQTDLHVDAGQTSFIASMCTGRKLWRVMTNEEYASVHHQIGVDGELINGKIIMGSIRRPFDTWDNNKGEERDDSSSSHTINSLKDVNVTIHEGILEPGEILYIPAGAPHAATTLEQSLMVASNDRTIQNLQEGVDFCEEIGDNHVACDGFRDRLKVVVENNLKYAKDIKQEKTSFPVSVGCEKTFQLLKEVNVTEISITPQNFAERIKEGPLIMMKSQRNCGFCLYLMKYWNKIMEVFDPPIRFGVLNCFQESCPHGDDELYQQLISTLKDLPSPQIIYATMSPKSRLTIVRYYGSFSLNDLKVWISVHTGANFELEPSWLKVLLTILHNLIHIVVVLVDIIGATGVGLLFGGGLLAFIIGLTSIYESWSCWRESRRKNKEKKH